MPLDEFWHGDIRLFDAYRKAYIRDVCYKAWKQGDYNRIAFEIGAKNAMATKKSEHINDWIEFKDPLEKLEKPKITNENLEQEFRKQQVLQNAWLHNILNK